MIGGGKQTFVALWPLSQIKEQDEFPADQSDFVWFSSSMFQLEL